MKATKMTFRILKDSLPLLLAAGLVVGPSLAVADVADVADVAGVADATKAAPVAAAMREAGHPALDVVRTSNLYRTQKRPYMQIPRGVAIWVRADDGITEAEVYREAVRRVQTDHDRDSLFQPGAAVSVHRDGGLFVIELTNDARSKALALQHRAQKAEGETVYMARRSNYGR